MFGFGVVRLVLLAASLTFAWTAAGVLLWLAREVRPAGQRRFAKGLALGVVVTALAGAEAAMTLGARVASLGAPWAIMLVIFLAALPWVLAGGAILDRARALRRASRRRALRMLRAAVVIGAVGATTAGWLPVGVAASLALWARGTAARTPWARLADGLCALSVASGWWYFMAFVAVMLGEAGDAVALGSLAGAHVMATAGGALSLAAGERPRPSTRNAAAAAAGTSAVALVVALWRLASDAADPAICAVAGVGAIAALVGSTAARGTLSRRVWRVAGHRRSGCGADRAGVGSGLEHPPARAGARMGRAADRRPAPAGSTPAAGGLGRWPDSGMGPSHAGRARPAVRDGSHPAYARRIPGPAGGDRLRRCGRAARRVALVRRRPHRACVGRPLRQEVVRGTGGGRSRGLRAAMTMPEGRLVVTAVRGNGPDAALGYVIAAVVAGPLVVLVTGVPDWLRDPAWVVGVIGVLLTVLSAAEAGHARAGVWPALAIPGVVMGAFLFDVMPVQLLAGKTGAAQLGLVAVALTCAVWLQGARTWAGRRPAPDVRGLLGRIVDGRLIWYDERLGDMPAEPGRLARLDAVVQLGSGAVGTFGDVTVARMPGGPAELYHASGPDGADLIAVVRESDEVVVANVVPALAPSGCERSTSQEGLSGDEWGRSGRSGSRRTVLTSRYGTLD